jgi:hypothetical protein
MNTTDSKEMVNVFELANAIVVQACEDYRDALRGNCDDPDSMLQDVMRFFKSKYYKLMTKVDYHYLLEKLDAEWEEGKQLIEAGKEVDCPKPLKHYEFDCPLCGGRAETWVKRHKTPKRKDGSRTTTYHKVFVCECHRPEQILFKQEVTTNEDNQNCPALHNSKDKR